MITQAYSDIVTPELLAGAIENNEFKGFKEDYAVLHCLIRKYKPTSFFEIGTSVGSGLNVICNAGKNWLMQVYSLDNFQDNGERTGTACTFGYTQLKGDSLEFDYSEYPCEGYFIDGAHDFQHVLREGNEAQEQGAKIIIFHDADIKEVAQGIHNTINVYGGMNYELFRVTGTRIAYALKKNQ